MSGDFNVADKSANIAHLIDQSAFEKGTVHLQDDGLNALNCEFNKMNPGQVKAVLAHMSGNDKFPQPDAGDTSLEQPSIIFFKTKDDRGLFVDLSVDMCAKKLENR